ncbi:MAG TPA: hypothetical protein VF507_06305 [Pyrinomonadaceae bacterium]|jgi:photosystem II stability/assembly factor-like uncharacterized protein
MKFQSSFRKISLLACALVLASFAVSHAGAASPDYKFKVHNNTRQTITKIWVAEEGSKEWAFMDIGDGIGPGETEVLVWDKSTDSSKCHWWFRAGFANGEQSESVKFDFCEKDLVLEFN